MTPLERFRKQVEDVLAYTAPELRFEKIMAAGQRLASAREETDETDVYILYVPRVPTCKCGVRACIGFVWTGPDGRDGNCIMCIGCAVRLVGSEAVNTLVTNHLSVGGEL